jgi:hypothetical protein
MEMQIEKQIINQNHYLVVDVTAKNEETNRKFNIFEGFDAKMIENMLISAFCLSPKCDQVPFTQGVAQGVLELSHKDFHDHS